MSKDLSLVERQLTRLSKSNKLTSTSQAVRVELVHGLLAESMKHAEEQMAYLKLMDEKLDLQANKTSTILAIVQSGITHL